MVEAGGTPVESPVVITGLCMALRGLLRGDTGRITGECSDQMVLDGVARGSTARGDLEFAINGAQAPVDGAGTDDQLLGDLGIGQFLGDQHQGCDGGHRFGHGHHVEWVAPLPVFPIVLHGFGRGE